MGSLYVVPPVTKSKFSAVDAARLALAPDPSPLTRTPRRSRLLRVAASMWCRELQFPTVREIGREVGLKSTSSATGGFRRMIYLQAEVVRDEWRQIEGLWTSSADECVQRIVQHAEELAAIDPSCVRLPGLVWSAVATAAPARVAAHPRLAPSLHALAGVVVPSAQRPDPVALRALLLAIDGWTCDRGVLAVPA